MERVADMDPVLAKAKALAKVKALTKSKAITNVKVNLKPSYTMKSCPPEKELNIKTGRCIKKCLTDEVRNASGRCVKNNTRKNVNKGNSLSKTRSKSKSRY
jgi:hypothetical protein